MAYQKPEIITVAVVNMAKCGADQVEDLVLTEHK